MEYVDISTAMSQVGASSVNSALCHGQQIQHQLLASHGIHIAGCFFTSAGSGELSHSDTPFAASKSFEWPDSLTIYICHLPNQ